VTQTAATKPPARSRLLWIGGGLAVLVVILGATWAVAIQTGAIANPFPRQPAPFPTPAETRDGRWQQDVEYLASQLPVLHANAFFQTPRETFDAETAALISAIPTLDDHQIVAGMVRLAALLGDGHTSVDPFNDGGFRQYPVQLAWYGDDLLVIGAAPDYAQALGATVNRIGETAIGEAFARITPYVDHDNAQHLRVSSERMLVTPEILHTAGLIAEMEAAPFTFLGADGESFTLNFAPLPFDAPTADWLNIYSAYNIDRPLRVQNHDRNYWYTYLEESGTIYFQYNRCANDRDQPFEQFAAEMFRFMDANAVQRVVIDLRYNGGGNSTIIRPFMDGMRNRSALNTPETFFALIGAGTFSSALMNAIDLDTQTNATLLGEGTGGKPNGYGEVRDFSLPNSGLRVQYSTRFFNNVPGYEGDSYQPNREIVLTAADVMAGRDPVLEAAIRGE
jgi:hypothetical protein